jgi:hypothetical protein
MIFMDSAANLRNVAYVNSDCPKARYFKILKTAIKKKQEYVKLDEQ